MAPVILIMISDTPKVSIRPYLFILSKVQMKNAL